MTNVELRMTKEVRITNVELRSVVTTDYGNASRFGLRHSTFPFVRAAAYLRDVETE